MINADALTEHSPAFAAWIKAINDHDLQGILDCYALHATLFATFENAVSTPEQRRRYFINFKSNPGMQAEVNTIQSEKNGDAAIVWGDYTFRHHKGGVENIVLARFTMAVENGKITHHHSSQLAGTRLAEADYKIQELETIADHAVSGAIKIKAGFCNLTPREPGAEASPFGMDGLLLGRYTIISKNGAVIHKHVSPDPSSALAEKLEKKSQDLRAAS